MFRTTSCSSSGESIASIHPLVGICHSVSVTATCAVRKGRVPFRPPRGCSKHVENLNKYIERNCASIWSFTMNHEGYGSLGQVLTVPQTLVVAHRVLVLDPLPTDVAASSGKCGVNPRQVLVEVWSPTDEFAAQLALQGLAGTAAHLYGGDRLVTSLRMGYKQKWHILQLQTSRFITLYS